MIGLRNPSLLLMMIILGLTCSGQEGIGSYSSRVAGFGEASIAVGGPFASLYNPALSGLTRETRGGISVQNHLAVSSLNSLALGLDGSMGSIGLGMTISSLGVYDYRRSQAMIAVSTKLTSEARLGMSSGLIHLAQGGGYGDAFIPVFGLGFSYAASSKWIIGFGCSNLSRSGIGKELFMKLPVKFETGFVHHASSSVRIFAQLSKDLVLPLDIRSGVEVSIRKHSALRCGFSTQRRTITCGYGFQRDRLSADIYQGWSQRTGMRFGMTISCLLRRSGEQ